MPASIFGIVWIQSCFFFWQISKVALFWQIFKVALFWQIFKVDLFWQIFKVALFWQIFKLVLKVKYKQLFLLQCNQLFQADIINNFHQVTRWSRNWSTDFGTDRETWSTTVKFIDTNWSTHRFPSTKEGFWVDRQKSLPCETCCPNVLDYPKFTFVKVSER